MKAWQISQDLREEARQNDLLTFENKVTCPYCLTNRRFVANARCVGCWKNRKGKAKRSMKPAHYDGALFR